MKPSSIKASAISGDIPSGVPTLLDVRYGHAENWRIVAEFGSGDEIVTVAFCRPTAFRITDEGNLLWYWSEREDSSQPAFVSVVEGSAWLTEYASSAAAPLEGVTHYLFAGSDECLEVLSQFEPVLTRTRR